MEDHKPNNNILIEEYKELNHNLRHYGVMRFAQLTLYFTLIAGLVNAVFINDWYFEYGSHFMLKIIAVLVSVAFWIIEERSSDFWHNFRRRAIEIEKTLGFSMYTNHPKAMHFLSATNAVRGILLSSTLVWTGLVIYDSYDMYFWGGRIPAAIASVAGLLILYLYICMWRRASQKDK